MVIAEHDGVRECDEYPASPPELHTFWEDKSGWLYLCVDYDHTDNCVFLLGVENKYSVESRRHNGNEYYEELFHFDHLYDPIDIEEEIQEDWYRTLVHGLNFSEFGYHWDNIKLQESEKEILLLGKVPGWD
jgi:hypothetical protein